MKDKSTTQKLNRRTFNKTVATGLISPGLISPGLIGPGLIGAGLTGPVKAIGENPGKPNHKVNHLHHVGGDYHAVMGEPGWNWNEKQKNWTNKRNFQYHQRHDVRHLTNIMDGIWDLDQMKRWKDDCDRSDMIWEAIRMDSGFIYAKPGEDRAKKLQEVIENVRKASAVGVKVVTMHWTLIPIRRNGHAEGRGGSSYHSFRLEENWRELPDGNHGKIGYDEYWERITFFLKNIIPVCAEYDVRLGVHPYDPPGLPRGYQGVDNWNAAPGSVFDSLKKYESIVDSPYNGFQLCLGTVMEGLKNPKTDLLPIVKYFADKGKIYQIHMRNIKGGLHDFQEVYIDEGEADFIDVVRILRDSGYAWSICPDHVPTHPEDPGGYQAFAQAFGYIRGMIDSANAEVR